MHKKEQVYDEKISPLMAEIIKICKDNNISFFCNFQIDDGNVSSCTSSIPKNSKHEFMCMLNQCAEEGGMNMDKFLIAVNKNYPNEGSVVMDRSFKNGEWRK